MTNLLADWARRRGTFITLDGPGGVGKTTVVAGVTAALAADGVVVHSAAQPSRAQLGEIASHGTDTYRGMALACLCAADRHHQLATEILPALDAGHQVLCAIATSPPRSYSKDSTTSLTPPSGNSTTASTSPT